MSNIINSETLTSNFNTGGFGAQMLHNAFCEFLKDWDSIEKAYRTKMSLVKERILLWQKYRLHLYEPRSSLKLIRKEMGERSLVSDVHELNEELSWVLVS